MYVMHIGIIILKACGERRNGKEIVRDREWESGRGLSKCMHNLFIYDLTLKITAYKYFAYDRRQQQQELKLKQNIFCYL